MIPILERPDTRETVHYLLEENSLLKEACLAQREDHVVYRDAAIQARTRIRNTLTLIDHLIAKAGTRGHGNVVELLTSVKTALTEL